MNNEENGSSTNAMESIHVSATMKAGANRRIIATARDHEMVMDVRTEWGGENAGPTPPEFLVMALGGCLVNICRIMAMERQIALQNLRVSITGDIDPSRAFGLETTTRAGFSQLSVLVEFSSSLSQSEKEEFRQELLQRCPLCDTISNPTILQILVA